MKPNSSFFMGARDVVADSLSRRDQVIGSELTLAQDVVNELGKRWLVIVNLFATSLNYWLPVYFSPLNDPMTVGMDAFLQSWDGLQAYAFLPFFLICSVLNKRAGVLSSPWWLIFATRRCGSRSSRAWRWLLWSPCH